MGNPGQVAEYQAAYPNMPVYLVGHSGGGGIAVFLLEALAKIGENMNYSRGVKISAPRVGNRRYYLPTEARGTGHPQPVSAPGVVNYDHGTGRGDSDVGGFLE